MYSNAVGGKENTRVVVEASANSMRANAYLSSQKGNRAWFWEAIRRNVEAGCIYLNMLLGLSPKLCWVDAAWEGFAVLILGRFNGRVF